MITPVKQEESACRNQWEGSVLWGKLRMRGWGHSGSSGAHGPAILLPPGKNEFNPPMEAREGTELVRVTAEAILSPF